MSSDQPAFEELPQVGGECGRVGITLVRLACDRFVDDRREIARHAGGQVARTVRRWLAREHVMQRGAECEHVGGAATVISDEGAGTVVRLEWWSDE